MLGHITFGDHFLAQRKTLGILVEGHVGVFYTKRYIILEDENVFHPSHVMLCSRTKVMLPIFLIKIQILMTRIKYFLHSFGAIRSNFPFQKKIAEI